ncbi:hypothetical protein CGCVW01_v011652 [Colletotrichum viniferum]|nr:hypothetical protein CGCVW01_v011652 [Colletotrichum viniferum]
MGCGLVRQRFSRLRKVVCPTSRVHRPRAPAHHDQAGGSSQGLVLGQSKLQSHCRSVDAALVG